MGRQQKLGPHLPIKKDSKGEIFFALRDWPLRYFPATGMIGYICQRVV